MSERCKRTNERMTQYSTSVGSIVIQLTVQSFFIQPGFLQRSRQTFHLIAQMLRMNLLVDEILPQGGQRLLIGTVFCRQFLVFLLQFFDFGFDVLAFVFCLAEDTNFTLDGWKMRIWREKRKRRNVMFLEGLQRL